MLAPVPKCRTTVLPRAARSSNRGSTSAMYSYESPWKPYRRTPRSVIDLGSANACDTGGAPLWNDVSKHATCGSCGERSRSDLMGGGVCGGGGGRGGRGFL